jgi:LPS sulfotransferase NodH
MEQQPSHYLICTTARSGSNLLCDYLCNTKLLGKPGELFNPRVVKGGHFQKRFEFDGAVPLAEYIDWIETELSSPNGVWGAKLLWEDFSFLQGFPAFRAMFSEARIYLLTRRSKLRQAVSYFLAQQTGQWMATDPASKPIEEVEFDFSTIRAHLDRLILQEGRWQSILEVSAIPYRDIVFEQLAADPHGMVHSIAADMGVWAAGDGAEPLRVSTEMVPQANARTREFVEEFCRLTDFRNQRPSGGIEYEGLRFVD